jgi:ribulose-5-phosphate 4-epimerase/fuculose-1-phosphate aldolase
MSLIEDLVISYRVLAAHGVIDGYGHISVRSNRDPLRYLIAIAVAPELVTENDIIECDLDSNPVKETGASLYRERFIHGEIYKVRSDVNAIVHNHSPSIIPFSVTSCAMRPIFHMAAFVGEGIPTFEIRDVQKGTNLLVETPELGKALAKTLSDKPAALMRGHGSVVVGENLAGATGRSVYLETSAKMQMQAMAIAGPEGEVAFMDDDEVKAAIEMQDYGRAWNLWRRQGMALLAASSKDGPGRG